MAKQPLIPGLPDDELADMTDPFSEGDDAPADEEELDFTMDDPEEGLLRVGRHPAICVAAIRGIAKSGSKKTTFEFRALDQQSRRNPQTHITDAPQQRWKLEEVWTALGGRVETGADGKKHMVGKVSELVGRPCTIEITRDEYDGRPTDNLKKVYKPDQAALMAFAEDGNGDTF